MVARAKYARTQYKTQEYRPMSYTYFIGIDISKDTFEVAVHDSAAKPEAYPNTSEGFAAFATQFDGVLHKALIVLEATGAYERALLIDLARRGTAVHRVQPAKAASYARSLRSHGKSDAIDARALARYGAERHGHLPLFMPPEQAQQELQDLYSRRQDLIAMRVAERQRRQHPRYADTLDSVQRMLTALDEEIAAIESRINALIRDNTRLRAKQQVMTELKGVGETTAMALLARMPELGRMTRRQAAALAGIAPHPNDSGKRSGHRSIRGGRQDVRTALYMAAISAITHNQHFKNMYQRLLQKGKKPLVAMNAVMRKMIVILNAKIRDAEMT
jgi:transposase